LIRQPGIERKEKQVTRNNEIRTQSPSTVEPTYIGHVALADQIQEPLAISDILPGLSGEAQEVTSVLDGNASLVVGANVSGAWHYSSGTIDTFDPEKAAELTGKFGQGTYLGVGDLTGETVDDLKATGAIKHDISFSGNVLALGRTQASAVAGRLRELKGLRPSRVRSSTTNAPLTNLVSDLTFEGKSVDAVMVYMDDDRTSAEIAVLPTAVENIQVDAVR
jgi:hypothetical protein